MRSDFRFSLLQVLALELQRDRFFEIRGEFVKRLRLSYGRQVLGKAILKQAKAGGYIPVPVTVTVWLPPSLVIEICPAKSPFACGWN